MIYFTSKVYVDPAVFWLTGTSGDNVMFLIFITKEETD